MPTTVDHIEKMVATASDLAETKVEIWKLKATRKIAESLSSLLSLLVLIVLAGTALLIISIGAAYRIGAALGTTSAGFFIIGGFYALAGLLLYCFRKKWIRHPLRNRIAESIARQS